MSGRSLSATRWRGGTAATDSARYAPPRWLLCGSQEHAIQHTEVLCLCAFTNCGRGRDSLLGHLADCRSTGGQICMYSWLVVRMVDLIR